MATTKADWDGWYATGYRALDVLDAALRDADFIVGDRYSAADICLYGYVHCAEEGGFDLRRYTNVTRWLNLVRSQPHHVSINDVGASFPPVRESLTP